MKKITFLLTLMMVGVFAGCASTGQAPATDKSGTETAKSDKDGDNEEGVVQTKDSQSELTPDAALKLLMDGNARFVANKPINTDDYRSQAKTTSDDGQFPFATILSCIDSRVSVEHIFDLNNGDAFNGRVAGNVVSEEMLGSFEFATQLAGSKVVMVLGHTKCGAVKGACDGAKLGNLTTLLDVINPSVEKIRKGWKEGEETNSKNAKFVQEVSDENVRATMRDILKKSEVIKKLVDEGKVKLVGGMYDISTGKVTLLEAEAEEKTEAAAA